MNSHRELPGKLIDRLGSAWVPMAFAAVLSGAANATPPLRIVAPANDTVVMAGTSLTVAVDARATSFPFGVAVVGDAPLGTSDVQPVSRKKLTFSLPISRDIAPGTYRLWAVTADAAGVPAESREVRLFVERSDAPYAMAAFPPSVLLHAAGETASWAVIGTFADGSRLDVTKSRRLKVTSENPAVATADHGSIQARSGGHTILDLRYGRARQRIPIMVSGTTR